MSRAQIKWRIMHQRKMRAGEISWQKTDTVSVLRSSSPFAMQKIGGMKNGEKNSAYFQCSP